MKLLVGLGNPGREYAFNRHNVGFMAVDAIAAAHDFPAWRKRFSGLAAEAKLGHEPVMLFKPQTFMNKSGIAVGEAVRFYKLELDDVVVFHDELDLAPGKMRVKMGGGVAGHNGLRSLSAHIGNDYVRVRIGIGHPGHKDRVSGYVLHDFSKADHDWLEPLLGAIAANAPYLADGANDRFQSRVAHTMQAEDGGAAEETAAPRGKAAPHRKEKAGAGKADKPAEGTLAERLRRWFGA
jgi:peptidyl-tRNA hydrolase, PTH1 family